MLAEAHRKAAEDIESTILSLQARGLRSSCYNWRSMGRGLSMDCLWLRNQISTTSEQSHTLRPLPAEPWWKSCRGLVGSFRPEQASWLVWGRAGSCRRSQGIVFVGADSPVGHPM